MSLFEYSIATIGTILAIWGAVRNIQADRYKKSVDLEAKKVNTKKEIRRIEDALNTAKFNQLDDKIKVLTALFQEIRAELKLVSKSLVETRESLAKTSVGMESFVKSTEKRLDHYYGKVTVIEDKISKYQFGGEND